MVHLLLKFQDQSLHLCLLCVKIYIRAKGYVYAVVTYKWFSQGCMMCKMSSEWKLSYYDVHKKVILS